MKKLKFGTNFTLFVLFFGISLLEAFNSGKSSIALFWLAVGLFFLLADNCKRKELL